MTKHPGFNQGAYREFIAEAEEQIERITLALSGPRSETFNPDITNALYRDLHTLKGNAQLFSCAALAQIAHTLESCIDSVRRRSEALYPELTDELFRGISLLERMVKALKDDKEVDFSKEMTRLVTQLTEIIARHYQGGQIAFGKDGPSDTQPKIMDSSPSPAPTSPKAEAVDTVAPAAAPQNTRHSPAPELPNRVEAPMEAKEPSKISTVPVEKDATVTVAAPDPANETLRVQVNLLDSLMNLVGELVLVRNQVVQKSNTQSEDAQFVNLSQRLDVITTELQNEIMKTRMQPIGTILTKFHRLVRDLSRDLNKEIILKLEGTETELDKTLIEAVKDPLTHIIRNSIDHGIESKEERAAKGKSKSGTVQIRAFHEGGQIVIEINDDGRGLQRQKIGAKAIERGLITTDAFKRMSDREVCNLIFLPGFSTAEKVSNISGRGVGMDVVRTNIEKIGGVVDINSVEGQGSTFRLKIPLTLAIVPALLVKTQGQCFAIPQVKLTELVRLQGDERNDNRIEYLQGQAVFRLRGKLLPLVSLENLLGINPSADIAIKSGSDTSIVVLQADAGVFGLIVDEIDDSTDIVVKSLSAFLKNLNVYSGATVLGDGSVALVLDVTGLAEQAKVFADNREGPASDVPTVSNYHEEVTEYLLIDIGVAGRYSIPLYVVNRLEEFQGSMIELTGDQLVVRYRDSILPLLNVADVLGGGSSSQEKPKDDALVSVIVVQQSGKLYGLVVNAILDIIGLPGVIDETVRDKACLLGTKIYASSVISIIDAFKVIQSRFPLLHMPLVEGKGLRVLYAEDSDFFQRQITSMLEQAGFDVTCATHGEEAFTLLQTKAPGSFDVVISDLDMPVLDGFGLAERIRASAQEPTIPVIALSSRAKALTEKQALKSGFDKYIEKSDVANLIDAIRPFASVMKEVKRGA